MGPTIGTPGGHAPKWSRCVLGSGVDGEQFAVGDVSRGAGDADDCGHAVLAAHKSGMAHQAAVVGITCGHCEQSVITELSNIDGVTDVAVDLETGDVAVTSTSQLEERAVHTAIDEAGFELVR